VVKHYKTLSGRVIHRRNGGQFRKSALSDIGLGNCERCGAIYPATIPGGIVSPRLVRIINSLCPDCREALKDTPDPIAGNPIAGSIIPAPKF
jgi:hypothetical protein